MSAFKPNPKKHDIEEREVVSLYTTDPAFIVLLEKFDARPSETHLERRVFLGTSWSDWKKVA